MKCGAIIIENRKIKGLEEIISAHLSMIPCDWGVERYNLPEIKTLTHYNHLLTSKDFWLQIPFDKVLIFQHDSEILKKGIEKFLEWDYIGSPWLFQSAGGNGGLSIRSRKVMLDVINYFPYKGEAFHGYEDVYFSNMIEQVGGKLAPREVCKEFACESIFELSTYGAHAIDKYLTKEQCSQIRNQYK